MKTKKLKIEKKSNKKKKLEEKKKERESMMKLGQEDYIRAQIKIRSFLQFQGLGTF